MKNNKKQCFQNIIRFAVLFTASVIFALACYDLLLFFGFRPFAGLYKMYTYHWAHPLPFILIPCFVFSIIAAAYCDKFKKASLNRQILITLAITVVTVIISSPLGGMLWHFYDMRAGYFPQDWAFKIIRYGFREGIQIGWLVILYSFPYNAMGIIISFFLMKTTAQFACGNADAQE